MHVVLLHGTTIGTIHEIYWCLRANRQGTMTIVLVAYCWRVAGPIYTVLSDTIYVARFSANPPGEAY